MQKDLSCPHHSSSLPTPSARPSFLSLHHAPDMASSSGLPSTSFETLHPLLPPPRSLLTPRNLSNNRPSPSPITQTSLPLRPWHAHQTAKTSSPSHLHIHLIPPSHSPPPPPPPSPPTALSKTYPRSGLLFSLSSSFVSLSSTSLTATNSFTFRIEPADAAETGL